MMPQSIGIQDQNQGPIDDVQKAEILASHIQQKIGITPILQIPFDINQAVIDHISIPGPTELAQPFTARELREAKKELKKNKAPGQDLIPYEFLTHLTQPPQASLLQVYNSTWTKGQYPSCWKHSILMPIHKPGKDPTTPSAYRPIALLSCIGKLMEHMVTKRISWHIDDQHLLQEEQCGFRPHRGTQDVLCQMEYHICDTYRHCQGAN